MKISINWLKDYVDFDKKFSIEDIVWRLTEATAEIEGVIDMAKDLEKVVIGEVKKLEKHPDADKLKVAQVDVGSETIQLVCGGVNLTEGMKVAVSLPGAMVRWHGEGEPVEVKKVKLRGVESTGMICAASEIGLEGFFPDEGDRDISDFSSYDAKPGQEVSELLMLDDKVFEVDNHSITHRPDLFSIYGFARECVALGLGTWKKQVTDYELEKMTGKEAMPFKVSFESKEMVSNYNAVIAEGLDARPSPAWMQARLTACGIRAINALVDITNYVMLELGAPMHAFDREDITGDHFQFRYSKEGETMITLDSKTQKLSEGIIVVENDGKIVDLVGVMGGEHTEVKEKTTSVYYHQGIYNAVSIRKAMISLGHRTDAGTIYEKGPEPELSEKGLGRTIELTKEIFPEATFSYQLFQEKNQSSVQNSIKLKFEKITKYIGLEIPKKVCEKILLDLGFQVTSDEESLEVIPPSWRAENITIPEDVIEEIIRIYGLSKIPALPPVVQLMTPVKNHKRHSKRIIQKFLTGEGFQEEANFSFLSEDLLRKANVTDFANMIEIVNPVNEDFRFMRPNFIPYLLNNLSRNQIREMKLWKSFEMGAVYKKIDKEVNEDHLLTLCIASPSKETVFADVKSSVQSLFDELSLSVQMMTGEHPYAYPGHCLALSSAGENIGHVYDVHPLLSENFKLRGSVTIVEIYMDRLYELSPVDVLYAQINRQPKALLDINVIVEEERMVSEIEEIIKSVEPSYLSSSKLVDVYQGESLGECKKSFTFALAYQHPDRTLEEKEIQDILDKLIKKLEKEGGVVRR